MSNTATDSSPRKRRQGKRLTDKQRRVAQEAFLAAFAETANIRASCVAAGIDRATYYRWMEHDETFSLRYHEAEHDADDVIRAELYRRAICGVDEPVVSAGKIVYENDGTPLLVRKYSDSLLANLAKARLPEFKERKEIEVNASVQHSGALNISRDDLRQLTDEELAQVKALLVSAKARQS